jgi:hypothetical protein
MWSLPHSVSKRSVSLMCANDDPVRNRDSLSRALPTSLLVKRGSNSITRRFGDARTGIAALSQRWVMAESRESGLC